MKVFPPDKAKLAKYKVIEAPVPKGLEKQVAAVFWGLLNLNANEGKKRNNKNTGKNIGGFRITVDEEASLFLQGPAWCWEEDEPFSFAMIDYFYFKIWHSANGTHEVHRKNTDQIEMLLTNTGVFESTSKRSPTHYVKCYLMDDGSIWTPAPQDAVLKGTHRTLAQKREEDAQMRKVAQDQKPAKAPRKRKGTPPPTDGDGSAEEFKRYAAANGWLAVELADGTYKAVKGGKVMAWQL